MSKNFSRHIHSKKHQAKLITTQNVRNGGISEVIQNGGLAQYKTLYTTRKTKIGADIRDSSTKLLPNPSWQKYPGEKHLKSYNYAGSGTRLDIRLDENNNPKPGEEPINKIDEACLKHDIAYESEDLKDRYVADVKLIHDLNSIKDLTWNEKLARTLIKNIMKAKIVFGGSYNLRNKEIDINKYKD